MENIKSWMDSLHHPSLTPWVDEILRDNYDHSLDELICRKFFEPGDCHQSQIQWLSLTSFSFELISHPAMKGVILDDFELMDSWLFFGYTFSAWTTVRGNPSRRKPFLHSGFERLESIRFTTNSSLTKSPKTCKSLRAFSLKLLE